VFLYLNDTKVSSNLRIKLHIFINRFHRWHWRCSFQG